MRRIAAITMFGLLLLGCGGAPVYTTRQALIDLPGYDHNIPTYDVPFTNCVVQYLFDHLPPAKVKATIRGADFDFAPAPDVVRGMQFCASVRGPY